MKASKFTGAQKAFVIEQGEGGSPVAQVCRNTVVVLEFGGASPDHLSGQRISIATSDDAGPRNHHLEPGRSGCR